MSKKQVKDYTQEVEVQEVAHKPSKVEMMARKDETYWYFMERWEDINDPKADDYNSPSKVVWRATYPHITSPKHVFIQSIFQRIEGMPISVGAIAGWLRKCHPEHVRRHKGYGTGRQAKVGRAKKDVYVGEDKGDVFLRRNGKWVKEYQLLMQDKIEAKKGLDYVVHHKNGDHTDNSPSNLELMPRALHSSIHNRKSVSVE